MSIWYVCKHFSSVLAVRLVVLFVNHVWATIVIWSPNHANTELNGITAAGKCVPRYDLHPEVSNSTAGHFWLARIIKAMYISKNSNIFQLMFFLFSHCLTFNTDWECLRTGCWENIWNCERWSLQETGENRIMRNFISCTLRQILLKWRNQGEWDGRGMEAAKWVQNFFIRKLEGKWPLERPRRRWENNIKMNSISFDLIRLTREFLQTRQRTFRF